jgi:hypothetical protein
VRKEEQLVVGCESSASEEEEEGGGGGGGVAPLHLSLAPLPPAPPPQSHTNLEILRNPKGNPMKWT